MTAVTIHSDFGAQENSLSVSIVSPSICDEVMGPDDMILVFWMLSFNPVFVTLLFFPPHNSYFPTYPTSPLNQPQADLPSWPWPGTCNSGAMLKQVSKENCKSLDWTERLWMISFC